MLRTAKVPPDDFPQALVAAEPPAGLTRALVGLWWDAIGDWQRAHESTQDQGRAAGHSSAPDREDMIISAWTGIVCKRDQS